MSGIGRWAMLELGKKTFYIFAAFIVHHDMYLCSGVGTVAAVAAMAAALFASFQRPKVIFMCRRLYYNYVTFNTLR